MLTPEQIDRILSRFDTQLTTIGTNLFNRLSRLVRSNLNDSGLAQLFAELDFFNEINKAGFQSAVSNLSGEYESLVNSIVQEAKQKGLNKIAGIGIDHLDTVINTDMQYLLRSGAMFGEQLKSSMVKTIVSGIPRSQIVNEILPQLQEQIKFNPSWLKTAINQAFASFQAITTAAVFEDAPQTRFTLVHRISKDSRPLCIHAIAEMAKYPDGLTITEINKGILYKGYQKRYKSEPDNYTFEQRGGFNCQGFWVIKEINTNGA